MLLSREDSIHLGVFSIWLLCMIVLYAWLTVNAPTVYRVPDQTPEDESWPVNMTIGNEADKLFWFIQITDIHISHLGIGKGKENLEEFLRDTLPAINPSFVVATGDLTDAKKSWMDSGQISSEWETYQDLLRKHGVLNRQKFWYDLRGNHDYFDVSSWNHPQNYFRTHSVTKREGSYVETIEFPFGKYALVMIDGVPPFGPKRPLNFFGYFPEEKVKALEPLIEAAVDDDDVKHIFAFSHYPISSMRFGHPSSIDFEEMATSFSLFMSGHLHQSPSLHASQMYLRNPSGFLDLELADMKDHRKYRIVAVDHDFISFSDQSIDSFPVIIITNPKNARFHIPAHEDSLAIIRSSHVRVLIFTKSPDEVESCLITLTKDGTSLSAMATRSSDNPVLWTAPWDASDYQRGIHDIKVTVTMKGTGEIITKHQRFSIDGKRLSIAPSRDRFLFNLPGTMFSYSVMLSFFFVFMILFLSRLPFLLNRSSWKSYIQTSNTQLSSMNRLKRPLYKVYLKMIILGSDTKHFSVVFWTVLWSAILPLQIARPGDTFSKEALFFSWGIWYPPVGWSFTTDTAIQFLYLFVAQMIPAVIFMVLLQRLPPRPAITQNVSKNAEVDSDDEVQEERNDSSPLMAKGFSKMQTVLLLPLFIGWFAVTLLSHVRSFMIFGWTFALLSFPLVTFIIYTLLIVRLFMLRLCNNTRYEPVMGKCKIQ